MTNRKIKRRDFSKLILSAVVFPVIPSLPGEEQTRKIKIAQVGTTHSHAEEKYGTVVRLQNLFEIKGLLEKNPVYLEKARNKPEFEKAAWISEQQLINKSDIEALLIENDFNDLLPTALKYAQKGYHLHIDKPPGASLDGLKKLFDIADEKNLVIQLGYMFRYNEAFKFCIDAVKKGMLGTIHQIDGVISKKISSKRRADLAASYGGAMMLLGCHLVDILVALCGKPDKVESFRKQTFPRMDSLYDNELAVFTYPGMTATVRSSLLEVGGMERRQFVVAGEFGTIEIKPLEPPRLALVLEKPFEQFEAGKYNVELPRAAGRYDMQLVDFALQISGERKVQFTKSHDLNVHETLLKACDLI